MLFNSVAFAIFFPLILLLYWSLRTPGRQNRLIVAASLFFYGWWDWRFVSLLLLSSVVDYVCALKISAAQGRGEKGLGWLRASLLVNLGLLGAFKYHDFFVTSAEPLWEALGWSPGLLRIVLPVGISFYTFQTMSYTIDVYRGQFEARRSLIDVAAYVTFFPQLVAGPIERATTLIPQLERPRSLTPAGARLGIMLIVSGLFKKMVLADGLGPIADALFHRAGRGEPLTPAEVLLAAYVFSFQLYGDFSGYSDIARGAARLLGFELMLNFRQPYFSRTFTEVWRRWHISLSFWLRDYLYISLGGSRGGKLLTLRNLFLTMFLGGLWHGAAWHFVAWGSYIGVILIVERLLGLQDTSRWGWPRQALGVVLTFHMWAASMIFFRADSIGTALRMFGDVGNPWVWPSVQQFSVLCVATAVLVLIDLPHLLHREEELPCADRKGWLFLTLVMAVVGFFLVPPVGNVQFIYFQF